MTPVGDPRCESDGPACFPPWPLRRPSASRWPAVDARRCSSSGSRASPRRTAATRRRAWTPARRRTSTPRRQRTRPETAGGTWALIRRRRPTPTLPSIRPRSGLRATRSRTSSSTPCCPAAADTASSSARRGRWRAGVRRAPRASPSPAPPRRASPGNSRRRGSGTASP